MITTGKAIIRHQSFKTDVSRDDQIREKRIKVKRGDVVMQSDPRGEDHRASIALHEVCHGAEELVCPAVPLDDVPPLDQFKADPGVVDPVSGPPPGDARGKAREPRSFNKPRDPPAAVVK